MNGIEKITGRIAAETKAETDRLLAAAEAEGRGRAFLDRLALDPARIADMAAGLDYFGYVAVELPAMCERMFGLPHERTKRYVMGLSMGGYGALKCALTYPERYAGVGSFSGVVDIRRPVYSVKTPAGAREREAIFGAGSPEGTKNDLYRLAQDVFDEKKSFPDIYLSCGEQDGLYEDNVKFDAFLTTLGAKHRFDHRAGAHSWRFWNDSVEECFGYFLGK